MKIKTSQLLPLWSLAPAMALVLAPKASAQAIKGPSTASTPYVLPVAPATETISVLTVDNTGATPDDAVPNLVGGAPYGMAGLPDGTGAFDNGDGTFTLLMNHEIVSGGAVRAHGTKGAFVSKWVINKNTLAVVGGTDLMTSVYNWDAATQSSSATPGAAALTRFCSGDLPEVSAYFNAASGLGTTARIYMHGEEGGGGRQQGTVATGPDAGKSYSLGKFNLTTNGSGLTGVGGWENALACPFPQDKTIVIGNSDGGTGQLTNAVAVYVGTKTNSGSEVDKAGLTNGVLKLINVTGYADGNPGTMDEFTNSTTRANVIPNGTRFTLSATVSTTFSRPEDGAWNPLNPAEFYFVTTDRLDQVSDGLGAQIGQTRLWRLTFDNITNPDAGGKIECLIDGQTVAGQKVNMLDNMTVNKTTGRLILQEDVGGAPHNGKVWEYDPATFTGATNSGALVMIAKHDPARFGDRAGGATTAATAPFNNDEESSGAVDITDIMATSVLNKGNPGEAWYLSVDQAHYGTGVTAAQVEGGQLFVLHQIAPVSNTLLASSTASSPYVLPILAGSESISVLTVDNTGATPDDTVPNLVGGAPYGMSGLPDGSGAFDNNDGTFTLVVNHEIVSGGAVRAHGTNGAYVSKWIINKDTLAVLGGTDLMTSVYGWDAIAQASLTTAGGAALTRFCSGDLPEVSAYFNAASGLGTTARIYMHGEEGGSGRQQGTVASGPDEGKSYTLGKFNLTTNGSGLTGVGAWENSLACPFPQDKTVVIGNSDGGTGQLTNAVAVYVGTKTSTGSEVDKAGLTNGVLKLLNVTGYADGNPGTMDEFTNTTTRENVIPNGTRFTLSDTVSTTFSRPEDGAWNPLDMSQYYFVTTDRLDQASDGLGVQIGQTRLWRLTFDDITSPEAGGIIECLIDGQTVAGHKINMLDNMTANKTTGRLILQEDVGGAAHNGKMWEYDPSTFTGVTNSGVATMIAKHDPARFGDRVPGFTKAAASPFTNDEEGTGVTDITDIMASSILSAGNINEAWYISSDQAHYGTGITPAQVEGGQIFVFHQLAPKNNVQATLSGYVRDRRTGTYAQQVALRNILAAPLAGPFYVVLDNLTPG